MQGLCNLSVCGEALNKACERCRGACCESIVLPLNAPNGDIGRWLDFHGTRTSQGLELECRCSKLKDGKSSIYEDRPQVCKVFRVGSAECRYAVHRKRSEQEAEEILKLMED